MRRAVVFILVGLLSVAPVAAEPGKHQSPAPARSSSTGKRVAWTLVGAAGGFAAGLFIGLNRFDDAINSDRKVWTSALVGAAAGGVAGALLSRNVGYSPGIARVRPDSRKDDVKPDVSWSAALGGTAALTPPSRRQPSQGY